MQYLSLQEIQSAELNLLAEFDTFCKINDLRYSLYAGTCLGAVRHKGFIPWDDDVDVCMPRPDYERLLSLSGTMPRHMSILTNRNSDWPQGYAKVQDMRVRVQEYELQGVLDECLWIDVFPFDTVPNNDADFLQTRLAVKKAVCSSVRAAYNANPRAGFLKRWAKSVYKIVLGSPSRRVRLRKKIDEALPPYDADPTAMLACYFANTSDVLVDKADFDNLVDLEFCGRYFKCLPNYDSWLKSIYGDYWVLPPEGERAAHHIRAWKVQNFIR